MAAKELEAWWRIDSNGCWIWFGALRGGYGLYTTGNYTHSAHRYVYEKYKKKIEAGKHLDHLCRVRRCVNPEHLEEVTNIQNIHRGNRCKINMREAEEIRDLYRHKVFIIRELASHYNISNATIYEILSNKIWRK